MPAEELPDIEAIKADMYPNILDAWTYKGKGTSKIGRFLGSVGVSSEMFRWFRRG